MATSLNSSDMTVNMVKKVMMALLGIVFLAACSSSDDEDLPRVGLTGKWDLVEIHDGPVGRCQSGYAKKYSSGSVIIELDGNGKIVFKYADGKVETLDYALTDNKEQYYSTFPIILIGDAPFGYEIVGGMLKLHYYGFYLCDHIPATFVFKPLR